MNTSNSSKPKSSKYPNIGNLTVALLEHVVEPFLGKEFIRELKLPYTNRQLFNKLRDALIRGEKEFIQQNQNSKIAEGLAQLHVADLNTIQKAFWHFVENPASPEFPRTIYKQLRTDFPTIPDKERVSAVNCYLKILKAEIININEEVRQKVGAAVLLSIESHLEEMNSTLTSIDGGIQDMRGGINQIVQILMALAGHDTQADERNVRTPGHPQDTLSLRHSLELSLQQDFGGLKPVDIEMLRRIISEWLPPLIKEHLDKDDIDRPYGTIIEEIVRRILPPAHYALLGSNYQADKEFQDSWEHMVKIIFRSDFVKSVPGHPMCNGVYLKSLSSNFPAATNMIEPYGYYLIDRELEYKQENGRMKILSVGPDGERFYLLCVTDRNLNGWGEYLHGTDDRRMNWQEKARQVVKNITKQQRDYFVHTLLFTHQKSLTFFGDLHKIGKSREHRINIDNGLFSLFIINFVEDFLSLAGQAIRNERQKGSSLKKLNDALGKK